MNNILTYTGKAVLSAVFPENIYCICCGDIMEPGRPHGLCDRCRQAMPWALDNPFSSYMEEFAFDDVWPCVRYGSLARKVMNGLKNGGKPYMAKNLALMMAERAQLAWEKADLVCAVPSHKAKKAQRGYNQAELLAREIARHLGLPFEKDLLLKTEQTASMRMATGQARRSMLEGSFSGGKGAAGRVTGKNIILVDDVTTTGSTADACARELKRLGAAKVFLLCFAASSGYKKPEDADEDYVFW